MSTKQHSNKASAHQVLYQFESLFRKSGTPAAEFIKQHQGPIDIDLQLEIIAVEIELISQQGKIPSLEALQQQFDYLDADLPGLFADTINDFVREYCPVRSMFGALPQTIGKYLLTSELARGGMGVVYHATQLSLEREVAFKVLFFSRREILDEARSLASLLHPNICRVYDTGMIQQMPFMAIQLIDGKTLADVVAHQGRLPMRDCVLLVSEIAQAMQAAHDKGIAHLDIKPSNIILDHENRPVLTDFGLARLSSEARNLMLGSPAYMAPEQLGRQSIEDRALCDIYSLGTVLFELLTGRPAFGGPTNYVIEQVQNDPPRRPSDYRPEIPDSLQQTCLRTLRKSPGDRFTSMMEFHDSLLSSLNNIK